MRSVITAAGACLNSDHARAGRSAQSHEPAAMNATSNHDVKALILWRVEKSAAGSETKSRHEWSYLERKEAKMKR